VPAKIVAVASQFPTVTGAGLVMDLSALEAFLVSHGTAPVAVTQWWLATADGQVPASLTRTLPPGATITSSAALSAATLADPLSAAAQQALLAADGGDPATAAADLAAALELAAPVGRAVARLRLAEALTLAGHALVVVAATTLTGLRALARGYAHGALWLALAVWLAIPSPYPWYALWLLPVTLAFPPSRATLALWIATIFAAASPVP